MLMESLEAINYNVIQILKEDSASRSSDKTLLNKYYKKHFNLEIDFTKIDNPASIIRCRRLIQKKNPSLRGASNVEIERNKHSNIYKNFAKNNEEEYFL